MPTIDRRGFLLGLGAAAACASSESEQTAPVELDPWDPEGDEDTDTFPTGIQVGDASTDGAILSLLVDVDGDVDVVVMSGTSGGWVEAIRETVRPDDGAIRLEVDVDPGLSHVALAYGPDGRSDVCRFRTPGLEGSRRILRFGATSCLGGNRPWPSLSRAAEEDLDLFLLLGDTIYNDWGFEPIREKWRICLSQEGMRDLTASTSLLATWDDHEVRNNFNPASIPDQVAEGLAAFRRAIPQGEGPDGAMWRSIRWGDTAEFFVLDCRGERFGNDYISPAQMDWLTDALTRSGAVFKIVLNSVPITDLSAIPIYGTLAQEDRWQGHPAQRTELLEHIADAGVTGVLWVSGDFHVGAVAMVDAEGGPAANQWEVLAGPGGSPISEQYSLVPEGGRIPVVATKHNYARFVCDPDAGTVEVRFIDDDGELIRLITLEVA